MRRRAATTALATLLVALSASGSASAQTTCETLAQCTVAEVQKTAAEAKATADAKVAEAQRTVAEAPSRIQQAVADARATVDANVRGLMSTADATVPVDTWACVFEGRMKRTYTTTPATSGSGPATCVRVDRDGAVDGGDATGARIGRFSFTTPSTQLTCDLFGADDFSLSISFSGDTETLSTVYHDLVYSRANAVIGTRNTAAGAGIGALRFVPVETVTQPGSDETTGCGNTDFFVEGAYVFAKDLPWDLRAPLEFVRSLANSG